jgi:protein-tyrosine phosphatase
MIPFSYNEEEDIEDIIDSIFNDPSPEPVFTMDAERKYECFHMITDEIAVGDYTAPYKDFDVVFNFNYPFNDVTLGAIDTEVDFYDGAIQKTIYKIGLLDTTIYNNTLLEIFTNLIPYLVHSKGKRILFHCYAGISRSSTAAILYLMLTTNMSLSEIYQLVESKRPYINPNPTFRHIIDICYTMRSHFNQ